MKTLTGRRWALTTSLAIAMSSATASDLKPFASDGCSLFPDADLIERADWCDCCFAHDIAYWRGGTKMERALADLQLRECVLKKTDNLLLANLMYEGVRLGGSPYFYNWYRWGYGWPYGRYYQILNPEESQRADRLLQDFLAGHPEGAVCADTPTAANRASD